MRYTLGQAARRLQASVGAYGVTDVRDAINRAVESLAGMSGWQCLRQVHRFASVGPCFTLPQGSAGLVRVCIGGRPATLRGTDFRFVHSGPGDLATVPSGFAAVKTENVLDLGESPVMVEPPSPFRIFACSAGREPAPAVEVTGTLTDGRIVTTLVPAVSAPTYSGTTLVSGQEPADVTPDQHVFQTLLGIVLDRGASDYVNLYAEDASSLARYQISSCHPSVLTPRFRRYSISGIGPEQPVEILAETRVDPLPLLRDNDPLPFDGIDPVEWMIRADWCMKSNEVDAAQKYVNQAASWLKAREVVNDSVQTPIIINSVYDNSLGELSRDAFNV